MVVVKAVGEVPPSEDAAVRQHGDVPGAEAAVTRGKRRHPCAAGHGGDRATSASTSSGPVQRLLWRHRGERGRRDVRHELVLGHSFGLSEATDNIFIFSCALGCNHLCGTNTMYFDSPRNVDFPLEFLGFVPPPLTLRQEPPHHVLCLARLALDLLLLRLAFDHR